MALDVDAPSRKAAKKLAFDLRYRGGVSVFDCISPDKDWSAAYRIHGIQGLAPIQDALKKFILCSKCGKSSFSSEKTFQTHEGKTYCWDCYQKVIVTPEQSVESPIGTFMRVTGIKAGSRVSTPQGLGTVLSIRDDLRVRVVLNACSDDRVKYFRSDGELSLKMREKVGIIRGPSLKLHVPSTLQGACSVNRYLQLS